MRVAAGFGAFRSDHDREVACGKIIHRDVAARNVSLIVVEVQVHGGPICSWGSEVVAGSGEALGMEDRSCGTVRESEQASCLRVASSCVV